MEYQLRGNKNIITQIGLKAFLGYFHIIEITYKL